MHDKIIAVIQALNQIEVKGKVNAAYLVAAINTLEYIIKEGEADGNVHTEPKS
jgi:uncharacterized protein YfeS